MNYWYVARPNELFLDIDSASRSIKHARARLQGAIESGRLDVSNVFAMPSTSNDHLHVIVTLRVPIFPETAMRVWEIMLHGDIYRGCCTIIRSICDVPAPSILINRFAIFPNGSGYARVADDSCDCTKKHKRAIMENCPAAIRLRGEFRNAGFFGKPSKNPCTIWPEL